MRRTSFATHAGMETLSSYFVREGDNHGASKTYFSRVSLPEQTYSGLEYDTLGIGYRQYVTNGAPSRSRTYKELTGGLQPLEPTNAQSTHIERGEGFKADPQLLKQIITKGDEGLSVYAYNLNGRPYGVRTRESRLERALC